jgi:hypothetical protein
LDALEQAALEGPATIRAVRVNLAPFPVETSAGLIETLLPSFAKQLQAQRGQPPGIVAALQFDITKQRAVAAHPAGGAKLRDGVAWIRIRLVHSSILHEPPKHSVSFCIREFGLCVELI